MDFSCLDAILGAGFEFTAGAGALFIDAATHLFSHFTRQCNAMYGFFLRSLHADMMRADRRGEFGRNGALLVCAGFSPVK